jgi:hypothetical protein
MPSALVRVATDRIHVFVGRVFGLFSGFGSIVTSFLESRFFAECVILIVSSFSHDAFLFCIADEIIRQVTINCAERGLLLLRVRDEVQQH